VKPQTYRNLIEIRTRTGKEYGKLIQKLLAIAFLETGAEELVDRCTQGIDLEVRIAGELHAFEVKTSEEDRITLGKKDLEGLDRQLDSGAKGYVAVLGGGLLDDWLFARYHRGELPSGKKLSTFQLRPYRDRDLERRVRSAFEEAVACHTNAAIYDRQQGLDRILEKYPARRLA
jgi:hypothetical protein